MIDESGERQILVDLLPHRKRRNNVERQLGHDAERAKPHDRPVKLFPVLIARQTYQIAVAVYYFQSRYCG